MIWTKTEAGRREIQARERVQVRAQRTLLLLIDGAKTDASLLASVAGIAPADFEVLHAMGLIEPGAAPVATPAARTAAPRPASWSAGMPAGDRSRTVSTAAAEPAATSGFDTTLPGPDTGAAPAAPARADDQRALTAALTQLIPTHLGVRGFTLTLAVEKASSLAELRAVAERTLEAIARRRGDTVAADARRALFGR